MALFSVEVSNTKVDIFQHGSRPDNATAINFNCSADSSTITLHALFRLEYKYCIFDIFFSDLLCKMCELVSPDAVVTKNILLPLKQL